MEKGNSVVSPQTELQQDSPGNEDSVADGDDAYSDEYGDEEYDGPDDAEDPYAFDDAADDVMGGDPEQDEYDDEYAGASFAEETQEAFHSPATASGVLETSEQVMSPQTELQQDSPGNEDAVADGDDAYSEYGDEEYDGPDDAEETPAAAPTGTPSGADPYHEEERAPEGKIELQKQDTYGFDDAADDAIRGDPGQDEYDDEYAGASFAEETQEAFHPAAPASRVLETNPQEPAAIFTGGPSQAPEASAAEEVSPFPMTLREEEDEEPEPLTARDEGGVAAAKPFSEPEPAEDPAPHVPPQEDQREDEGPLTAREEVETQRLEEDSPPAFPETETRDSALWGDKDLAAAIEAYQAEDFGRAGSLAKKATESFQDTARRELATAEDFDAEATDSGDLWRTAMDKLAAAHENAGDAERAEALYLRMLAWREGVEQFEASNYSVGETLFQKSSSYRSVEDATWFLHQLRPSDGHAAPEVVGLLALGEEVAAKAAIAVWTLALKPEHREKLTHCGALELVAKAVAFHGANVELQAAGCGALKLLCTGHSLAPKNRRLLVSRLGGPESILAAMRTHGEDVEVWREGCGALRALAHKNPAGARRIIENGGFNLCLEALESTEEAVSSVASKALAELRCASQVGGKLTDAQAENLQALWEGRLREDRETGLRICSDKLREHLLAGNRVVVEAMLATLCIFAEDNLRYKYLHVIPTVITCMQALPCHEKIQVPACKILCSMTATSTLGSEHEEGIQRLAKCNGIGAVVQAMKDMPCHMQLQRLALTVLRNFTHGSDVNKTLAVRAGAIPATVTAMQRFRKDTELQDQAISALTSLCDTLGRASVAARLGAIEGIISAMKGQSFGENEGRIIELGCIILCMFCDDAKLRRHVQKAGAANVAKKVINKAKNLDIQRWGCELLRCISQPT